MIEFIGQQRLKAKLEILAQQAQDNGSIPHMGLFGRAGQGKTTFAKVISNRFHAHLIYLNGTATKDPISFLNQMREAKLNPEQRYIVFIDEAHMLPRTIQENMLSILEEPNILSFNAPRKIEGRSKDFVKGELVVVKMPKNISFMLGTTHKGNLRDTILSRLEHLNLDEYDENDIITILQKTSHIQMPYNIYQAINNTSKNIRQAKKYLKSFEAYVKLKLRQVIPNEGHFKRFCEIHGVDSDGCDKTDISYMEILAEHKKVGLNTLISMLGVSAEEIQTIVEPWLLKKGYITITPRGRTLTLSGKQRMGLGTEEEFPFA